MNMIDMITQCILYNSPWQLITSAGVRLSGCFNQDSSELIRLICDNY